jgi:hypothetical protein
LGRRAFRLTKTGTQLVQPPGSLFSELIPYIVSRIEHAAYARFDDRLIREWDAWMYVINEKADHGSKEAALIETFCVERQGWHTAVWREMAAV